METFEVEDGKLKHTIEQPVPEPVVTFYSYNFLVGQLQSAQNQLAQAEAEVDRHEKLIEECKKAGLDQPVVAEVDKANEPA